ncbi:hypothetical protein CKQ84_01200 [Shewanella sp. WE21]|jgi:hypothetical protein|uniref:hypothetical protein n=1 Tax=Shewanella sp. WE21 TaxID=2029986 RepID=UPI000CF6E1DA|nr:hypothetical protein [Shewanella sp. WE21]AVI64602.1 hypothetical protein CKQ84_01200 [Shewanella sp. WE21]
MNKTLVILAFTLMIFGCGNSQPTIEITYEYQTTFGYTYPSINVKAISDTVTINKVIINRGNCGGTIMSGLPKLLKFGESISVIANGNCDVKQVDVLTDDGDWSVTF